MQLFGPDFAAAGAFVPVLAIGLVARAMVGPAELYFNVLGEQRACALLLTGAVLVGVVLQLALISAHGLAGGAWASAATLVLLSVGFHLLARWRLGLTLAPHVPWRLLPSEGVNPQG
jgi:O-antigen/teichoic acid export membrane protein